ncbi:MAG: HAD-IIIC family phosphatase [Pedosphaera sp.]|nr:HAD-IIIC family phosphatase [Pedosphaera sp.]
MGAELTIQFVRNYTAEPLGDAVQEAAQPIGLAVKTQFGAFDNLGAEIAALSSAPEPPAIVVVTIDLDYFSGGLFSPKWQLAQVMDDFNSLLAAIEAIPPKSFVLISTFIPAFRTSMPLAPGHPVLGRDSAAFELNRTLRDFIARRPNRCGLLDFERIAARLGEAATLDRRFGLMMKAPFRPEFIAAAAGEIIRHLRCRYLPPKKVLVLDCDNTLWGGIVGEVGPEGIQLDPYEYPGIAYYRFQSEVLAIAERGVLICLCSKNDEPAVWQVLDQHPHCLLRRDRIAGHRINWVDKATNLKELALELNLSLDSMVFVDDSPAECELIRSQFPEVTVLQVPAKIYEFPGLLGASNLFDRLSVSQEDKDRVQYYQAETDRRELQTRHVDAEGFLRDLKMKAVVHPVQSADVPRASQLCQRTNQFNLTTKRYTESDLTVFLSDPDVRMFLLQAEDRFGSIGHSGLIIFRRLGGVVEVDTFLMSCRLIGRQLDRALFCQSLRLVAQAWTTGEIRAHYLPTRKNGIVAGLWKEYGFAPITSVEGESYACPVGGLKVSFPEIIQLEPQL